MFSPPHSLQSDYVVNQIGIGSRKPVLGWKVTSGENVSVTSAWQILVSDSLSNLRDGQATLWDSGKVLSSANEAEYEGAKMRSRQRCWWMVRFWSELGDMSAWSEPAFWETGLLDPADWQGEWIGSDMIGGPHCTVPIPYLRKAFQLRDTVKSARLYATALGLYECEINGKRIGEAVFTPGWTDYKKRVCYHTFDVTEFLQAEENVWGVILGDGWYCGGVGDRGRQIYGDRPHFLAQLEVTFADGTCDVISTQKDWRTATGPILESDLLMGETYDARLELTGWSEASYDDSFWRPVRIFEKPSITIDTPQTPAVCRAESLPATLIACPSTGVGATTIQIYDFKQNFSGRLRISVRGPRGSYIRLRHGEMLDAKGRVYTANLREARATDYYVLKGETIEMFEPRFTYHGFRYAEVTCQRGEFERVYQSSADIEIVSIEGVVLHSHVPKTGHFECSNPLINQLHKNTLWSLKSNFLEVPTDCPQRNERLGWTGDALIFARTACFHADVRSFFHKWMQDVRDAQGDSGYVPCVVPLVVCGPVDGGPAWSDATIICPWTIYLCYGDTRILAEHYPSMQRYIDYLVASSNDLIRSHPESAGWKGFGDWFALDGSDSPYGLTPFDLIGTAFFAHDAELMARVAALLGHFEDEHRYRVLHQRIVTAFQKRFVTFGGLSSETQTASILALRFDLLPTELRASAAKNLVQSVEKNGFHLSTGFVGTPLLCEVLEDTGYIDIAYKVLEQESCPSWLFQVKNGATTIWERWDSWTPERGFQEVEGGNSFNHYAFGSIGAWIIRSVGGLEIDPIGPGYRQIIFRPRPGGSINWAETSLETPHGLTSIRWSLMRDALTLDLIVPPNARATLSMPPGFTTPKTTVFLPGNHHICQQPIRS